MLRNLPSEWFATRLSSRFLLPLAAYLLADIWIHFACWVPVLLALYLNWGALDLKKFWNIEDLEATLDCFPRILREHAGILGFCMQSWARKLSVLFVFVGGSRFFYVFPCRWFMLVTWFVDVTTMESWVGMRSFLRTHDVSSTDVFLLLTVGPPPIYLRGQTSPNLIVKSWGCCWL